MIIFISEKKYNIQAWITKMAIHVLDACVTYQLYDTVHDIQPGIYCGYIKCIIACIFDHMTQNQRCMHGKVSRAINGHKSSKKYKHLKSTAELRAYKRINDLQLAYGKVNIPILPLLYPSNH